MSSHCSAIGKCLKCLNFGLNKDTEVSPLLSVMTSARDTEDEYLHEFKLNPEISHDEMKKNESYLDSRLDCELMASNPPSPRISPESRPIRVTNMFGMPKCFSGVPIKKRERKEESLKKRSMSYDINSNKFICHCCKKHDLSVLSTSMPSSPSDSHLCTRCSSALKKKQDYANTKNGKAEVSDKAPNLVEFTCEKGHSWTVNIHRGYKNWCSTCIKIAKEEKKKLYKRQSSRINREYADRQKRLFDEALSQCVDSSEEDSFSGNFEDVFDSILSVAKSKAEAYMNQPNSPPSCTYEQALSVYKILELDVSRVQFILKGMSADSKKVGYKKLAMVLHPDKNRHPLSKEAFQKASELFNSS